MLAGKRRIAVLAYTIILLCLSAAAHMKSAADSGISDAPKEAVAGDKKDIPNPNLWHQNYDILIPFEYNRIPKIPPANYIPKKPGRYSRDDWSEVIDATWGWGLPNQTKNEIFFQFWSIIDRAFPCFDDLPPDIWDQVHDLYYPEIEAGVSKGRFSAILSHASLKLRESHTRARDLDVHNTQPLPGVPIMYVGGWGDINSHFGAALTPLPDSSLLVYKVVENHPLGLESGDLVFGYDGIPWKDLYHQLLEAELPLSNQFWGSCPSSFTHSMLMAAGLNWHLFDTIDIVKYSTGETLHLATSALIDQQMYLIGTEQLDIPGVPMPDFFQEDQVVSSGIIEGTKIGYIYEIGWGYDAREKWDLAIYSMMSTNETTGLIIDFRVNFGGNMWLAYPGLSLLFNTTVETIGFDARSDSNDHFSMHTIQEPGDLPIEGSPSSYYNKPIAVLVGPGAVSSGDQIALAMAFHPMTKFFGKSTASAFNSPRESDIFHSDFFFFYAYADAFLAINPGHYLTHDEFPSEEDFPWVDYEPCWLTQEGVAQGRDDVVETAMAWILSRDLDQDGIVNENDNCPEYLNPMQEDFDSDTVGDSCDNCIRVYNPEQIDSNENDFGDACDYICGDTDDDETINILDIVFLINFLYKGGASPPHINSADNNYDESVNILDVVNLINHLYKSGAELNCPLPQ